MDNDKTRIVASRTFRENRVTHPEILRDFQTTREVPTQVDRAVLVTRGETSGVDRGSLMIRATATLRDLELTNREVFLISRTQDPSVNSEEVHHHQEV